MTMSRCQIVAGLALCAGLASAVPPNPAPPISSGPDVVCSSIGSGSGQAPFGDTAGTATQKDGTIGAISAFSTGTVSCNIGNADAIWSSGDNRHPLIGTQIYRFRTVNGAGQMDMVGLNWLKHSFCAADETNCSQLTNPAGTTSGGAGCTWLGPFRTDYYWAGLNAAQDDLGPRSEVNPWTGSYLYPYQLGGFGATGNAIFKRTQVPHADLIAGAQYLFEVFYMATDEPVSNRYNNYSYRLANISGSGSSATFTYSGPTQAMQTAVDAWRALESGVTKVSIDPSGVSDGRLTLGYKVTQTGPNTWHYEYLLHNMNNDAGVRSFSLPLDSNVVLTNVGFKDVTYHSGEPYSSTDWTFANGGGAASWSTQTFAQNVNANALRWGTGYSFRFDANIGPTTGTLTLGMFKTGASVAVNNIQVPAVPPPPTPGPFNLSSPASGSTVGSLTPTLSWSASSGADTYEVVVATDSGLTSVVASASGLPGTSWAVPAASLVNGTTYHWGVTAFNGAGRTGSTPGSWSFLTPPACVGDLNNDGSTNVSDLTIFLANFGTSVTPNTNGDLDGNGNVNVSDLTIFLASFGCPS